MATRPLALATICIVLLLGAGCSQSPVPGPPKVVVSIAPLHSLVAAVMADVATPDLLLGAGQSPHSFSLRPSDARRLQEADLLVWIGPSLEQPLQRILSSLRPARQATMLRAPGVRLLASRRNEDMTETAADPAPEGPAALATGLDPHVWLSIRNALAMVDALTRTLTEVDPPNAQQYQNNAAALALRLRALDLELQALLADIQGGYMVFHDAYQYFEQDYGLRPSGRIASHPERGPGAAHLSRLQDRLRDGDVRCLFSEPQYDPKLVAMLASDLNMGHAVLDPLGADIPPGPTAYEETMRRIGVNFGNCMRGVQDR